VRSTSATPGLRTRGDSSRAIEGPTALPDAEIPWDAEHRTVVFRVLQESLTNVARHACAHKVSVALWREHEGDALLEVSDDGDGIDAGLGARPGALGLVGMRERAQLCGGSLTVTGVAGGGTTVLLRLPCQPNEPQDEGRHRVGDDAVAQAAEAKA